MDWSDRIGRRIRLRDLHIVLAVAEEGSMAKASTKLAISHPVISKTVADLERTLGVSLFDRNSRGVELTAYGEALLKCGINVFDEMRQGLKRIEFLADPTSGNLTVGGPEIVMAGILPAISESFLHRFPAVQLRAVSCRYGNDAVWPIAQSRGRAVDRPGAATVDRRTIVISEPLLEEPFVAIAGKDTEWARRRRIELSDLIGEPWVLPPYDSAPGALITELFGSCGVKPPEPRGCDLSNPIGRSRSSQWQLVGLLPSSVARLSSRRVGLKILPDQAADEHTLLVGNHHAQKPDPRPTGKAVHRAGARGRKISACIEQTAPVRALPERKRTRPIGRPFRYTLRNFPGTQRLRVIAVAVAVEAIGIVVDVVLVVIGVVRCLIEHALTRTVIAAAAATR